LRAIARALVALVRYHAARFDAERPVRFFEWLGLRCRATYHPTTGRWLIERRSGNAWLPYALRDASPNATADELAASLNPG
jgi:hypothetical protein